ncbi:hypothetical protein N7495_008228 [Penicillium taxi]|uniref:uncharacterized protein n=1 Tax=Penicillium taxi TaxID=168475 RepID=UPI0025453F36|nr:uncharacterized protein N7495_008228 [Penicillium taxi]KAJ5888187.1 hypothetical protein N7495_008228 [Penicillium taxi]
MASDRDSDPRSILYAVDANTFASLALLNRQWRRASESPSLYAHHLSQCPSFIWSRGVIPTPSEEGLSDIKRQFLEEVRRNAFDVFLRPRRTLVRMISSSMSSSTAFPQGEVFRFSFSANGHMVLCISSSRIVVLDVATDPVTVKHELIIRRRPQGAAIKDDGTLLAVLSSTHRVNIYTLSSEEAKHIQTIVLNDAPRDLTFSPTGSVLALSFEDSIEVYAVGEGVLATERRAARCLRVEALSFTTDGSMLLGSSGDFDHDGIVTITAPFYTETGTDASPEELQMRMWTTQILFPEQIGGLSHACLIPEHEELDDSWILGYDCQLAAFRAIKVTNPNTGGIYFASPFQEDELREMPPLMHPAVDDAGELAALGFKDSEVWIYGVPKRLDIAPANSSQDSDVTRFGGCHHCNSHRDNLAQLQKIVPTRKALIRGRCLTNIHGITSARWVHSASSIKPKHRLVAVAPGGVHPQAFGQEDIPVDGGRILLLDFERSTTNGEETELDIEVGETAPKMLPEPKSSLDAEVELERRRTQMVRGDRVSRTSPIGDSQLLHAPALQGGIRPGAIPEMPYDNTQPRSQDTLTRAATAAASTRGRYDPRYRNTPPRRRQIPHESDADNWVPPPPPYKPEPDEPLPQRLQHSLLPNALPVFQAHDVSVQQNQITRTDLRDRLRGLSIIPSGRESYTPRTEMAHPNNQGNPGQQPMPSLGATMLGPNYYPYSISSPNLLQTNQLNNNPLDPSVGDEEQTALRQIFHRRVLTEPTSLPPPEDEEWRRRIEDWNNRTVRERSRRRHKCIIM